MASSIAGVSTLPEIGRHLRIERNHHAVGQAHHRADRRIHHSGSYRIRQRCGGQIVEGKHGDRMNGNRPERFNILDAETSGFEQYAIELRGTYPVSGRT